MRNPQDPSPTFTDSGIYHSYLHGAMLVEDRRLAYQAALAKLDEIRLLVANGSTLENVFAVYGPVDFEADPFGSKLKGTGSYTTVDANGYVKNPDGTGDKATFVVGEDTNNNGTLDVGEDLNANGILDVFLNPIAGRPLGTVTIITNENPREADFGVLYGRPMDTSSSNWYERNPFGVDINGNRFFRDVCPAPFPMDINGDGDSNDTTDGVHRANDKRDDVVVDGLKFLPVVVTIQWIGPYGPERVDVFSVITREHP
jgi:hypothetical protein